MAKSLARQRAQRFDWQKLVTPFTSKAWVAEMQAYEKDLSSKKVNSQSLSQTVEPIDWAAWEAEIETEGVVAELKAEYEAMTFAAATPDGSEISDARAAQMIADAEADVRLAQYELAAADQVLSVVKRAKNEGQTWTHEQWESYVPGYNQNFDDRYEDEAFVPTDQSFKNQGVDFKDLQKRIAAGDKSALDELAVDDKIGDMSTKEELEVMAKGEWSIARVVADAEARAKISAEVAAIKAN